MTFEKKYKPQSLASPSVLGHARDALECVESTTVLGEIVEKAKVYLEIKKALDQSLRSLQLESLINHIHIGSFSDSTGQLLLLAHSSASASRISQKRTTLAFELQKAGWPVQSMEIQIQPQNAPKLGLWEHPPEETKSTQPLPAKAQQAFSQLSQKLSGNPELQEAIEALLKKSSGK